VWPKVAHAWTRSTHRQRIKIFQFGSAAMLFACGAGDGNRTRTISLGMATMPAWAHGGHGQSCPYLTVSARQGSFVDR
jgi:hypothetical protein